MATSQRILTWAVNTQGYSPTPTSHTPFTSQTVRPRWPLPVGTQVRAISVTCQSCWELSETALQ